MAGQPGPRRATSKICGGCIERGRPESVIGHGAEEREHREHLGVAEATWSSFFPEAETLETLQAARRGALPESLNGRRDQMVVDPQAGQAAFRSVKHLTKVSIVFGQRHDHGLVDACEIIAINRSRTVASRSAGNVWLVSRGYPGVAARNRCTCPSTR